MDNAKRDKKYLGIDTNVLVAFPDKEHPDNLKTKMLVEHRHHAVNPTIIHEACHTLVYKQKWMREDAENVLFRVSGFGYDSVPEPDKANDKTWTKIRDDLRAWRKRCINNCEFYFKFNRENGKRAGDTIT